jgi:hypothetical protein
MEFLGAMKELGMIDRQILAGRLTLTKVDPNLRSVCEARIASLY